LGSESRENYKAFAPHVIHWVIMTGPVDNFGNAKYKIVITDRTSRGKEDKNSGERETEEAKA
jgi:hypothetical protein